jgi:hypothetical protein
MREKSRYRIGWIRKADQEQTEHGEFKHFHLPLVQTDHE